MKLGIVGYSGKMGSVVYNYLKDLGYKFVFLCDKDNPVDEKMMETKIDAVIDFSTPESLKNVAQICLNKGIPLISGTTNVSSEIKEMLNERSKANHTSVSLIANFLPSINYLYCFLQNIESIYDEIYIDEKHHKSKKDAPSGTAMFLRRAIPSEKEVPISAKRVNIFIYEHQVTLINEWEEMTISHRVFSKIGYAKGVEKVLKTVNSFTGLKEII